MTSSASQGQSGIVVTLGLRVQIYRGRITIDGWEPTGRRNLTYNRVKLGKEVSSLVDQFVRVLIFLLRGRLGLLAWNL